MISSEQIYDTLWESGWVGYDNILNCRIPKECLIHLKSIWNDNEHDDLIDSGEFWEYAYDPDDDYNPFLICLWMYYNFYKITRSCNWKKDTSYLLGEVMWLLIERGHRGLDEESYNQFIFHKKEKGINRTSFHKCIPQLHLTNGKPWLKKKQEEIGNIIVKQGEQIYLSDEWFNYLIEY
jgi:hypothetical protein